MSVAFPVVEVADGGIVSSVDGPSRDVGRVVTDVDDRLDAAGFGVGFPWCWLVVVCVSEGLDEEGGDVLVGAASLSEMCVEILDVFVSYFGVAVQVLEAEELAKDEALEG